MVVWPKVLPWVQMLRHVQRVYIMPLQIIVVSQGFRRPGLGRRLGFCFFFVLFLFPIYFSCFGECFLVYRTSPGFPGAWGRRQWLSFHFGVSFPLILCYLCLIQLWDCVEPMCSTLLMEDSGPFYIAGLLRLIIWQRVFGFWADTDQLKCLV